MAVSIWGIILNVLLAIVILIVLILAIIKNGELNDCGTIESPFCPMIICPCDNTDTTCKGYAKKPGTREGTFFCSYNPTMEVDAAGNAL